MNDNDEIKINTYDRLDRLKEECKEYLNNPEYVYKFCSDCIVIMQKLQDTITNENRINVRNQLYAKFRANKLFVVKIINIDNMKYIDEIINNYYDIKIIYKCNEIVVPDKFDEDIDKVCSSGIHYFKSIDPAFYYRDKPPKDFTGKWIRWYENGNKRNECEYIDGKETGKCIELYEDGNKRSEGECIDFRTGCGETSSGTAGLDRRAGPTVRKLPKRMDHVLGPLACDR